MSNKSLAFGLVAAAILLAPTTAIADDQSQYNEQRTYQNGAAIDGSINVQNSETRSYQEQIQRNDSRRDYYRRKYDGRYYDRDRDYDDDDRYYHRPDYYYYGR
ncbi:MAG: hypothetical protein HXY43_25955 [Fischerella sp.]|jgi:hypothetical protein|uniref:hypothetical protein n=1 Tax=Fischerella sp. TaxID=1191 RepID=UPI0017AC387F|nr:hypothetical protein [Fischerella sp.]NWF62584.1 hypothetical protein [Fischerella sp.]